MSRAAFDRRRYPRSIRLASSTIDSSTNLYFSSFSTKSQILRILIKFFWFPIKILSKSASIPITVRNFHESRIFKINRISLRFVSIQRRVASDINWIMELTKHEKATIDFPSRLEEVSLGDSSFRS